MNILGSGCAFVPLGKGTAVFVSASAGLYFLKTDQSREITQCSAVEAVLRRDVNSRRTPSNNDGLYSEALEY